MHTVAFHTLGCKVNQYDSQAMLEAFLASGYKQADFEDVADVYVINTCTVTGTGDKKSMQAVRRALRRNPDAAVVVAGCLAQRAAGELLLPGVRLVLGTQHRARVVSLLERALAEDTALVAVDELTSAPFERLAVTAHEGRTRAVLKIQEGCDRRCSYCIIPDVRGPVRSRPLADVRAEAARLAGAGFMEIVLTGIHLTSYGKDMADGTSLIDAIRAVHETQGVRRIRLGSLEPRVVTADFVRALKGLPKVCPHFNLALQSGSDAVLQRMRRRYTSAEFLRACGMLRQAFPTAAITTDVMTGFPGETEEEFEQTRRTVQEAGFARMHVFPYSERLGTVAADMPNPVPREVREERARALIAQGRTLQQTYLRGLLGSVQEVLLEEGDGEGRVAGYTPQYVRVAVRGGTAGQLCRVRLTCAEGETMAGEWLEDHHTEDHHTGREATQVEDCLFCKIARGEIPSNKVYEDEEVLAFQDIAPQAKNHVLVVPKRHFDQFDAAEQGMNDAQLAHLFRVAAKIARDLGLHSTGYRLVTNCGPHACQSVQHLHMHILGGNQLSGSMV